MNSQEISVRTLREFADKHYKEVTIREFGDVVVADFKKIKSLFKKEHNEELERKDISFIIMRMLSQRGSV